MPQEPWAVVKGKTAVNLGNLSRRSDWATIGDVAPRLAFTPAHAPKTTACSSSPQFSQRGRFPRPEVKTGLAEKWSAGKYRPRLEVFLRYIFLLHVFRPEWNLVFILRATGNESGERSGVSPPVPCSCTGKLTHAAHQLSHSWPRGVFTTRLKSTLERSRARQGPAAKPSWTSTTPHIRNQICGYQSCNNETTDDETPNKNCCFDTPDGRHIWIARG